MASPDTNQELPFDELIERLRAVVEKLETGKLSLDDSLKAYEDGIRLARTGHTALERAEKRVEVLSGEPGEDGEPSTEPLEPGDDTPL